MTTDVIKLFAKYNSVVNKEMNKFISQLSAAEWEKELGGFYKNVRSICLHVYQADFNWLKRYAALRPFPSLDLPLFKNSYSKENPPFQTVQDYLGKRTELDTIIVSFADEISQEDLDKNLRYKNFKGEEMNLNFGGLLMHFFNHQTHSRGIISLYLELLGKENDYSNLIKLLQ